MTKEEKAMINRDYAYEEYGELCFKVMFNDFVRMELTLEDLKFLSAIGAVSVEDEELKEELDREETLTTEKYSNENGYRFISIADKDAADIFYGYVSEYMIDNEISIKDAKANAPYANNNLENMIRRNKGIKDDREDDLETPKQNITR